MARRRTTVCARPGCPELTDSSYCAEHAPKPWATSTRNQRVASGSRQQADAKLVMRRDRGICHVCHKPGADQVDHVIPTYLGGPDTPANKAPIHAQPCHADKTKAERIDARWPGRTG